MGKAGVRVQVTEADITKASKANSMKCVVAQAIARTRPDATHIDVDIQTIRWTENGERFVYLTPYSVAGYVIAFDAGDKIEPFTFQLNGERRVTVRRRVTTSAGKTADRTRDAARRKRAKAQLAKAAVKTASTPAEVEVATEVARLAEAEATQARETAEGAKAAHKASVQATTTGGTRQPPPRVFKTNMRHYGHRVLRVNQEG